MAMVAMVLAATALAVAIWGLVVALPLGRRVQDLSRRLDVVKRDQRPTERPAEASVPGGNPRAGERPAEPPVLAEDPRRTERSAKASGPAIDTPQSIAGGGFAQVAGATAVAAPLSTAPEPRPFRPRAVSAPSQIYASPTPPVITEPSAERRLADVGRVAAVRDRVARYRDLLAQRAKPRLLQDVIEEDSEARAIVCDADGSTLSLAAVDPNDPGQMLVAFAGPEHDTFVVLPTFEYLENFRVAFSAPVQNPAVVRSLFELEQDDGGGLRLIDPALVRLDEGNVLRKVREGRLGGFASGV